MSLSLAKEQIESVLANRFGNAFERRERRPVKTLSTGVAEIDQALPGIPRGAITEIHGAASSGRTTLLLSSLAVATFQEETCALVDGGDTFDLSCAAMAGVSFDRLLWIRCRHNLEKAFKAVDLLLHSGGFGLIVLNLSEVPAKAARRIVSSWWFRFRHAIENTPTALIVVTPLACVRSCAALVLEVKSEAAVWPHTLPLVSKNSDNHLSGKRASHLSVVTTAPAYLPGNRPTHTQLLHQLRISVNQERPVQWSPPAITFIAPR
jgi:recA bacterial DNA recombination protein